MGKLTPRQQRFVEEYLLDMNATQAAIRAGYSKKTARSQGQRLLTYADLLNQIWIAPQKRSERIEISQDRVLREYARIAFFDPRKLFQKDGRPIDITSLDDDTAAALVGLDVLEEYDGTGRDRRFIGYTKKYKIADKLKALDALREHLGMRNSTHLEDKEFGVIEIGGVAGEETV